MSDKSILDHITELVSEEQQLRSAPGQAGSSATRLKHVQEQLDQCWDLLRQRRAKREFGQDVEDAKARSVDQVEHYLQ